MLDGSEPNFLELLAAEEEQMEDTSHCAIRAGPAVPDNTGPKGPPPPRPVHEDRDPQREADGAQAGSSRGDSRDAQPLNADGAQVVAREDREPSSSSSTSGSEPEGSVSGNSLTWSETSLVLEGPSLAQAGSQLVSDYRSQVLQDEPAISTRSLAGKIGAMRRMVRRANWHEVQRIARIRLHGEHLRRWQRYEFEATHEHRPRRLAGRHD